MNCPLCGEVCSCQSEPPPAALEVLGAANEGAPPEDGAAWRDELSARLDRYRARRKMRPPRYPSLSLQFDPVSHPGGAGSGRDTLEFRTDQALALDGMPPQSHASEPGDDSREFPAAHAAILEGVPAPAPPAFSAESGLVGATTSGAKIIEFPRFAWGPPAPPPDQLAEPVLDRPRILEVPEVEPPPPALGGITIERVELPDPEKRPGIDIPLQSAPLARRLFATAIDGLIVLAASTMFGAIFWKLAAVRPPLVQLVGLAAAIPCLFWTAYQYLLIVYAASTPGLRAAGLELTRFDGSVTSRSLRRWRVVASYLSAASLGMGYAWTFLDEDALCWHDRITHTYLAPRNRGPQ